MIDRVECNGGSLSIQRMTIMLHVYNHATNILRVWRQFCVNTISQLKELTRCYLRYSNCRKKYEYIIIIILWFL